ncbi:hypothetical protein PFLUV_G00026720 [Perca fluviatilis]|uniref:Uncharacterized protein n=1 Tax=Perca fluviatilis TaxID=8168 RepID=A0A6A5EZ24_PERFL|nr:hypothetical protein PFLUV_G00026720 [Perca fluviatilis]
MKIIEFEATTGGVHHKVVLSFKIRIRTLEGPRPLTTAVLIPALSRVLVLPTVLPGIPGRGAPEGRTAEREIKTLEGCAFSIITWG